MTETHVPEEPLVPPLHIHQAPDDRGLGIHEHDAVLALDATSPKHHTCTFCAARYTPSSRWSLQVSGVNAVEVERVAVALLQQVDAGSPPGADVVLGDKYVVHGSAMAVGPEAVASVIGDWNQFASEVDVHELVAELALLRSQLDATDIDQAEVLGALACAEKAVKEGDGAGVLGWLRKAGARSLEVAEKVGTDVAAAAIKKALGLP